MALQNQIPTAPIDLVAEARRAILSALKRFGRATIQSLADALSISTEAVRQQLSQLQRDGWVVSDCGPDDEEDPARSRGRPAAEYCLSPRGDDLFPKQYADLARTFFDGLDDVTQTLTVMTDERVQAMSSALPRAPLGKRIEALRSIYIPHDPYTDVEKSERGYRLVERNCPYLQFATERPLFCSTTVSALRRLTDREVVREKRFQDGDGKCVFYIYTDSPVTRRRRFEPEPPREAVPDVRKGR